MQFGGKKKATPVTTVTPEPSYNIPLVLGGVSIINRAPLNCAHRKSICSSSRNVLVLETWQSFLAAARTSQHPLAGIAGLSALQGNIGLAGLTGILGAFLAFQVTFP